jgi:hypothetical protein
MSKPRKYDFVKYRKGARKGDVWVVLDPEEKPEKHWRGHTGLVLKKIAYIPFENCDSNEFKQHLTQEGAGIVSGFYEKYNQIKLTEGEVINLVNERVSEIDAQIKRLEDKRQNTLDILNVLLELHRE